MTFDDIYNTYFSDLQKDLEISYGENTSLRTSDLWAWQDKEREYDMHSEFEWGTRGLQCTIRNIIFKHYTGKRLIAYLLLAYTEEIILDHRYTNEDRYKMAMYLKSVEYACIDQLLADMPWRWHYSSRKLLPELYIESAKTTFSYKERHRFWESAKKHIEYILCHTKIAYIRHVSKDKRLENMRKSIEMRNETYHMYPSDIIQFEREKL